MATATELPPFLPKTVIEGCLTTSHSAFFRLFGLHEPDRDPYHQGRPDPFLFDQADYFQERRGSVPNCDYSAVHVRGAIAKRGKRAGNSGLFQQVPGSAGFRPDNTPRCHAIEDAREKARP